MIPQKDKYSLWIVPSGEVGDTMRSLIDRLSEQYRAPAFVPHLTLVANIFADSSEFVDVRQKVEELSESIGSFTLTLTGYDFKDEEFRSLYLLASSEQLDAVFERVASVFPQVDTEHFRAMPHFSVLYGDYSAETKRQIIQDNPLTSTEITVDAFELYLTNDPTPSWGSAGKFPLP